MTSLFVLDNWSPRKWDRSARRWCSQTCWRLFKATLTDTCKLYLWSWLTSVSAPERSQMSHFVFIIQLKLTAMWTCNIMALYNILNARIEIVLVIKQLWQSQVEIHLWHFNLLVPILDTCSYFLWSEYIATLHKVWSSSIVHVCQHSRSKSEKTLPGIVTLLSLSCCIRILPEEVGRK